MHRVLCKAIPWLFVEYLLMVGINVLALRLVRNPLVISVTWAWQVKSLGFTVKHDLRSKGGALLESNPISLWLIVYIVSLVCHLYWGLRVPIFCPLEPSSLTHLWRNSLTDPKNRLSHNLVIWIAALDVSVLPPCLFPLLHHWRPMAILTLMLETDPNIVSSSRDTPMVYIKAWWLPFSVPWHPSPCFAITPSFRAVAMLNNASRDYRQCHLDN